MPEWALGHGDAVPADRLWAAWDAAPPVLLAAAWGWVLGQDLRAGERHGAARVTAAALAGFVVTVITTLGLAGAGLLAGPTFSGFGDVVGESLLLGAVGAVLVVLVGLRRVLRAAVMRSAWVGDQRIAVSDDVVIVEGNAYFPVSAVPGVLSASSTTTVCPWKGVACYHNVTVDGTQLPDAAWTYRHPTPLARRVKGRVAFWGGVEIREP